MKVLSIDAAFPVILAPIAGVSDLPFRTLCKEQGCDFTFTEMVSAKGLSYQNENTERLLETDPRERPCGVQLFGREPRMMAEMAKRLCERYEGEIACIDVNMGCPVRKVVKNGEGSALMLEPALAGRVVRALERASGLPVSAKFRKGFDDAHANAVEFAKVLEDNGASMLTVHGRTREQMYSGRADYEIIAKVKAAVSIPVIGNGDVFSGADALRLRDETNCDGIMVARGAMGNPFIFKEIKAAFAQESYTPPTDAEKLSLAIEHAKRLCAYKGERGVIEMRKHASWYLKGMRGATALRGRFNECKSEEELVSLLAQFREVAARH